MRLTYSVPHFRGSLCFHRLPVFRGHLTKNHCSRLTMSLDIWIVNVFFIRAEFLLNAYNKAVNKMEVLFEVEILIFNHFFSKLSGSHSTINLTNFFWMLLGVCRCILFIFIGLLRLSWGVTLTKNIIFDHRWQSWQCCAPLRARLFSAEAAPESCGDRSSAQIRSWGKNKKLATTEMDCRNVL